MIADINLLEKESQLFCFCVQFPDVPNKHALIDQRKRDIKCLNGIRSTDPSTTGTSCRGWLLERPLYSESHSPIPIIVVQTGFHNAVLNWSWLLTRVVEKIACVQQPNPQGSISNCYITTREIEQNIN